MAAGKLTEPKVITDFNQKIVCLLPTGFYFDDTRWDKIWQRYEEKNDTLSMADLKTMFPDEPTVQNAAEETDEKFDRCGG
ncbi:MAG: hypothetical protein OEZ15_02720 [Gammaproteobacteria bacterium]|nr:hypothetical protein [Gammaproteobacteria bacterium]